MTSALSVDPVGRHYVGPVGHARGGVLTLNDPRGGHFLKMSLTRTLDPIRPTMRGPDPTRTTKRAIFWKTVRRGPCRPAVRADGADRALVFTHAGLQQSKGVFIATQLN